MLKKCLVILFAVSLVFSVSLAYAAKVTIRFDPGAYRPGVPPKNLKMMNVIIEEYEKLHPDVEIKLVGVGEYGGQDYGTWLQTRLLTKDAPEIFQCNYDAAWTLYSRGWFTDWIPYLGKPNPYVPGNKRWVDIFYPFMCREARAPDGKIYTVVPDSAGTTTVYNKDIFKKVGVSVPTTWGKFINVMGKIRAQGIIPFGNTTYAICCPGIHWPIQRIQGGLIPKELVQQLDIDKSGRIDVREVCKAVSEGAFRADLPFFKETWRLMKEFSKFWPPGFTGQLDLRQLFLTQKIAMYMTHTQDLTVIERDPRRNFEWGTMDFPIITKADSPLGQNKLVGEFGLWGGLQLSIPSYLPKEAKDVAVDFCMYISAPKQLERLVLEEGGFVPNVKGVKVPKGLETVRNPKAVNDPLHGVAFFGSVDFEDKYNREANNFLTDKISFDEFISRMQKIFEDTTKIIIRDNPEWGIKLQ
jgi:ABC-type glycerol-3-phosphate transport system substrate-binding protein